jgi:hypothetical protein
MQYSLAHCDWHTPLFPQTQDCTNITRLWMPIGWTPWQHVTHALPDEFIAHVWSVMPLVVPLLELVALPLLEPLPLVLPEPLLELLPPSPLRGLGLGVVLLEQPAAYAATATVKHVTRLKGCLNFTRSS